MYDYDDDFVMDMRTVERHIAHHDFQQKPDPPTPWQFRDEQHGKLDALKRLPQNVRRIIGN